MPKSNVKLPRGRLPNGESFESLIAAHRAEILAYLIRMLGNRPDAEDACQDSWLRAYRAFPRLADRSNLRAWLFQIATRTALNLRRQRGRRSGPMVAINPDGLPDPSSPATVASPRVVAAVRALPPKQRAALMQRVFHDLSYDEIARTLGGTATAARANVYQALKRLRLALVESATRKGNK